MFKYICIVLNVWVRLSVAYDPQSEVTGSTDLVKDAGNKILLFSTLDGTLIAVDQQDGQIRWKHKDEPAVKVPVDISQAIHPIILPDPKDGSLYLLSGQDRSGSLKKLAFTIPELVASAPCRSSDGILYTGKKTDQWFLVEPRSGQREAVLGWGSEPINVPNTCPLSPGSSIYIGRTHYEVLMLEVGATKRKWNVTFFDYAAEAMTTEMLNNYDMIHFSASSTGLLLTMERISGRVLWKVDLGSPVVAAYVLTPTGLIRAPFTSMAHHTLEQLSETTMQSTRMRLYPTLYVGEHIHGLYALPSLVDQNTVTITASQSGPLLLEGPTIGADNRARTGAHRGQNIRIFPNQFDSTHNMPSLQSIIKGTNAIILLGHYNVPDFSQTHLQLSGRISHATSISQTWGTSVDQENGSDVDIKPPGDGRRNVEVQTEDVENESDGLVKSVKNIYAATKNWLNKQDNKGLKLALIIVVGCMIAMFWYVKAQFKEFQQLSQGSSGSWNMQGGPITAFMEELANGMVRVGKITFHPEEILGRGCEGTFVYKGEFEGRSVAVKRLLPECFSLADREVSLLKESDAHPHVVRYHCTERDRQFRYIALELCAATLYEYVKTPKQITAILPPISDMEILQQATAGIAHLHSLDIVHRDIKPQNVLLWVGRGGAEVRAMISDFGLCKKLQIGRTSFSRRSGVTGTDGWIAPEMLNGSDKTTMAVDIFSLGCVFYFVLSGGKHPFGEPLRRQANILSNSFKLSELHGGPDMCQLAEQLVESLIIPTPKKRPPASAVLKHPIFWTKSTVLSFLQDVSDRVEKALPSDRVLIALEENGERVVQDDWRMHVDNAIVADLRKYRTYRGESVRDLLRALRNKKHHYRELTVEAQQELGDIPDAFTNYWTSRFPNLLVHTWLAMQCVRQEPAFRLYYHQTYSYAEVQIIENLTPLELRPVLMNETADDGKAKQLGEKSPRLKKNLERYRDSSYIDSINNDTLQVDTTKTKTYSKTMYKDRTSNLNYDWRSGRCAENSKSAFSIEQKYPLPFREVGGTDTRQDEDEVGVCKPRLMVTKTKKVTNRKTNEQPLIWSLPPETKKKH